MCAKGRTIDKETDEQIAWLMAREATCVIQHTNRFLLLAALLLFNHYDENARLNYIFHCTNGRQSHIVNYGVDSLHHTIHFDVIP